MRAVLALVVALSFLCFSPAVRAEPSKLSRTEKAMTLGDVWFDCCQPESIGNDPFVLVCRKKTNPVVLWMRHKCDALANLLCRHRKKSGLSRCDACDVRFECDCGY